MDRAVGALVASAAGDSLGAGYEFGPPLPADAPVEMIGGGIGNFAVGEWTDDTSMAIPVAEVASTGADLTSDEALNQIVEGWFRWADGGPADIGIQTRAVMSLAKKRTAAGLRDAARQHFRRNPSRSAGNGALMRTAPVALASLEPEAVMAGAKAISDLTHADPVSGEACAIWSLGIAHAIRHGTFDGVRLALEHLSPDRAAYWGERLDEAEARPANSFRRNGWVVEALQAAWSAITRTPVPDANPAAHLKLALENAVRAGHDTDTVACIAGGLLGARWGVSAVPLEWKRVLHGWPGYRAHDLQRIASPGEPDYVGQPGMATLARHPLDGGLWLGGYDAVVSPPEEVDAVVSLCRLKNGHWPAPGVAPENHVMVWLADADDRANPNLRHVLDEAASAVARLRAEGRTVLLHCVSAQSRTPTVAALYAQRLGHAPTEALRKLEGALPAVAPNPTFAAIIAGGDERR